MGDDYQGSIAQKNVTFVTDTVVQTTPGDNYYKLMIFIAETDMGTYLEGAPTVTTTLWVTSTTYANLTKGLLKTWLAGFFSGNSVSQVFLAVYVDINGTWDPTDLEAKYDLYKTYAYFKSCIYSLGTAPDLALAGFITAEGKDKKLSQQWIGIHDPTGALATTLDAAGDDAYMVHHYDTDLNGALSQLGVSLAKVNSTITPVGNSLDYVQTDTIDASGALGTYLLPAVYNVLSALNVGYFSPLGNSTGRVVLEGGFMIGGDIAAANWISNYIDFVCEIKTAEYITQMNMFLNNDTYQGILGILQEQLNKFVAFGRLTNVQITAPVFSALGATGDTLIIPNAWSATYSDQVRTVTVYGTLYVSLS